MIIAYYSIGCQLCMENKRLLGCLFMNEKKERKKDEIYVLKEKIKNAIEWLLSNCWLFHQSGNFEPRRYFISRNDFPISTMIEDDNMASMSTSLDENKIEIKTEAPTGKNLKKTVLHPVFFWFAIFTKVEDS